jgi:anti-anti-sigma regulatory factor
MEFNTEEIGGVAVARLKGVLDSAGVVRLQENVESLLIARERKVVLDFSEIDALDPMGLAELLKLSRWVKEGGFRLRVAHAAAHVEEAFRDNMISDVEFFRNVDAASKFTADAPRPPRVAEVPAPVPRQVRPEKSLIRKYWWVGAAALLAVILGVAGVLIAGKFASKKVEFLTENGQPWTANLEESLKPGQERVIRFQVRNADQVLPIRNEDWIEMRVEPGDGPDQKQVVFRFAPDKDFAPTDTYFYVTAGDGSTRLRTPTIYLTSDVEAVLPKFNIAGRDHEKHADGVEGIPLAPGIEGEQYGPDGISATGGANIRYRASGHEPYGLVFDEITGRFSGEAQQATPNGGYVPIKVVARNEVGEATLTALLFIEKKKVTETKTQAVNVFGDEIKKRFDLININSLAAENIALLFTYKNMIVDQGKGEIHKVGTVFFPKGATQLPVEYQRRLDAEFESNRFRELAADKLTYFFVLGFADKGKTADAVNLKLIKDRAEKLKEYLCKHLATRYGLGNDELARRVRVIPMQPVPDDASGQPLIFDSRERSRAGEIWLVKDPRK